MFFLQNFIKKSHPAKSSPVVHLNSTLASRTLLLVIVAVVSAFGAITLVRAAVAVTATKTYAFIGGDGDGKADPGETIEYTVNVTNGGSTDAAGLQFDDNPDPNTTFVPGSLSASPVAANDSYTATGNVSISLPAGSGVLANDYLGLNPTATITAFDAVSANGGTVVVNPDGSLSYDPPAGFTGTDTFTYTLSNPTGSSTGAVSITVSGMLWFINNKVEVCSSSCNGRLSHPFTTLAAFNAVNDGAGGHPANNDAIFVYESAISYSGAVTLRSGQKLIGQDATASLAAITSLTPPAGSAAFPVMNSVNGTVTRLTSTVTLNTNTTLRGLSINSTTSTGLNDPAGAITGVSVSEVSVATTTGTPVLLSSTGGTLSFKSISASSALNGISLADTTGSFTVTGDGGASNDGSGGTITGTTGEGILLNNAANVTLGYLNITNSGVNGIRGTTVNGFTLNRSSISDNAGNVATDDGVNLSDTSGALTLTNNVITNARHQGITVDNNNTDLANLTMDGNSVTGTVGGDGVLVQMRGTSVLTAGAITNNTFSNSSSTGLQVANSGTTANILSLNVLNNVVNANNAGLDFDLAQNTSMTILVQNNTITNSHTQALNLFRGTEASSGSLTATLRSNTIGTNGVFDSGSAIGNGIRVAGGGNNESLTIDGNRIHEVPNARGIDIEAQAYAVPNNVNVKIVNNIVTRPNGTNQNIGCGLNEPCPGASIFLLSDNNGGPGENVCTVVSGNLAYDPTSWPVGGEAAFYFARRSTPANLLQLEGNTGLSPAQNILNNNIVTDLNFGDFFDEGDPGLATTVVPSGTCGIFPASLQIPEHNFGPQALNASWIQTSGAHTPAINSSHSEPSAVTSQLTPALSGGIVSLNVGALPAGKSVTIKYRVTVNGPSLPLGTFQLSNQGTVSYDPSQTTLTDDPAVGGTSDPTIIPVDRPDTTVLSIARDGSTPTNASSVSWTVTFADPIIAITSSNFTLVNSGLGGAPAITGVVPVGGEPAAQWTVTAGTGTGDGTLGLNLVNDAGTSHDVTNAPFTGQVYTIDHTSPAVTLNQAVGQADPASAAPINFTAVFSEPVTGFATGDVTLSGSAGATAGVVTEIAPNDGTTYTVAISGMTQDGKVSASIPSGVALDAAANPNTASTSSDSTVIYDTQPPDVTINQAVGQSDPTSTSPINFTVVFSEPVTGFATGDVALTGSAGATTGTVTQIAPNDGTTYNVAVSGMTGDGAVIASIPAGVAADLASKPNNSSTSIDNTVTYDATAPDTTITANPTNPTSSRSASFSFTGSDGSGSGIASFECDLDGGGFSACTSPQTYSGLSDGSHTFQVRAIDNVGKVDPSPASFTWVVDASAPDTAITGNPANPSNSSSASFSFTGSDGSGTGVAGFECDLDGGGFSACSSPQNYNGLSDVSHTFQVRAVDNAGNVDATPASFTWTVDTTPPSVVVSSLATSPTNTAPILVTITFSEPVTGFTPAVAAGDIVITNGSDSNPVTVDSRTFTFDLTPSGQGPVTVVVPSGSAFDAASNPNTVSNLFSITYDNVSPTVTINQAAGQADPTNIAPINFTVVFSEPVTGFATGDVTLGGTAGATTATVAEVAPNDGTTYNVAVSGMTTGGTVFATVNAGVAQDAAFNGNAASTSTDNTVNFTFDTTTSLTVTYGSSLFGTPVTLAAVVAVVPPGVGAPTGSVAFYDGATLVGTAPLDANGVARLVLPSISYGQHALKVVYSGDPNFAASQQTSQVLIPWRILMTLIFK